MTCVSWQPLENHRLIAGVHSNVVTACFSDCRVKRFFSKFFSFHHLTFFYNPETISGEYQWPYLVWNINAWYTQCGFGSLHPGGRCIPRARVKCRSVWLRRWGPGRKLTGSLFGNEWGVFVARPVWKKWSCESWKGTSLGPLDLDRGFRLSSGISTNSQWCDSMAVWRFNEAALAMRWEKVGRSGGKSEVQKKSMTGEGLTKGGLDRG